MSRPLSWLSWCSLDCEAVADSCRLCLQLRRDCRRRYSSARPPAGGVARPGRRRVRVAQLAPPGLFRSEPSRVCIAVASLFVSTVVLVVLSLHLLSFLYPPLLSSVPLLAGARQDVVAIKFISHHCHLERFDTPIASDTTAPMPQVRGARDRCTWGGVSSRSVHASADATRSQVHPSPPPPYLLSTTRDTPEQEAPPQNDGPSGNNSRARTERGLSALVPSAWLLSFSLLPPLFR